MARERREKALKGDFFRNFLSLGQSNTFVLNFRVRTKIDQKSQFPAS